MPITPSTTADQELVLTFDKMSRGLDSRSQPTETDPAHLPTGLQNAVVDGGYYQRVVGSTLHATDMVLPDGKHPKDMAYYVPSTGTACYIAYGQDGVIYKWTGTAWVTLRSGSDTGSAVYGTHTQIGDYLILVNGINPNYKYDGTRCLPLGAKHICDFESDETWTGGTADTVNIRQGTQGRKLNCPASSPVTMTYTPATPLNLTLPLLLAKDYTASDYIHFAVYFDTVAVLDVDNTYVRFGNAGDTVHFTLPASSWGTLAAGWNTVHMLKSAFTNTGGADWATIAKVTFTLDATAPVDINMTVDDCYMIYADVMPPVQFISNWKNMVIGGKTLDNPSDVVFSPVSSPDEYDVAADIPIDSNDGTQVTGLFPYYDLFLVTKDNSVHTLTVRLSGISYPEYVFGVKRVTGEHGASSHRAIVEAQGKVYMWWAGAIYKFEGLLTTKVSYRVDPTLHDFEPTLMYQAVAMPYRKGNKLYLWWTPAGDTQNTSGIIYDYQEQAFLPMVGQSVGWAGTSFESGTEVPLTGTYTGRILDQSTGETFDGATISTVIPLPWVSAGPPHGVVSWREVQVHYATNTGTLVVQYRIANHPREMDTASWITAASIDMAATGEYGRVFIGERSRFIQFRFTSAGYPLSLYWPITVKGRSLGFIQ